MTELSFIEYILQLNAANASEKIDVAVSRSLNIPFNERSFREFIGR